jgi:perosamine synthetase
MTNIPVARPDLRQEDIDAVVAVLQSGWVVQGRQVESFEQAMAEFAGAAHAVAVTSCTTALHLGLDLAGVGPGDDVLVPAFTWIASANAVEYTGARPVFCDIDLASYNASAAELERAMTEATRAIVPVHLFGLCADMPAIVDLAGRRQLAVIEDAACGLGATIDGRHSGTFGDAGCFSFHPRKSVTTGEGGMLLTDREDWALRARVLRDHGASIPDRQRHESARPYDLPEFAERGYNYRMTDIQAALGVTQMRRVGEILDRRRSLAARYDEALGECEWLRRPAISHGREHGYQAYVCLMTAQPSDLQHIEDNGRLRDRVMEHMSAAGVSTRPGTHAVHLQRWYAERYRLQPQDFPNAWIAHRTSIALPLYHQMTDADQDRVIASLVEAFEACAASPAS